jgi:hypothetical protein
MTDHANDPPGNDPAAERLARDAGARLRASADNLDAATRARLNRARQQAVAAIPARPGPGRWLLPAAAVAVAGLVAVLVFRPDPGVGPTAPGTAAVADLELLLPGDAAADLEMLEDLEFYAWLDEGRSPEELRAELDGVG